MVTYDYVISEMCHDSGQRSPDDTYTRQLLRNSGYWATGKNLKGYLLNICLKL